MMKERISIYPLDQRCQTLNRSLNSRLAEINRNLSGIKEKNEMNQNESKLKC